MCEESKLAEWYSPLGVIVQSITETLLPLGDELVFIPGHGPSSTFGREKASNPYLTQPIW